MNMNDSITKTFRDFLLAPSPNASSFTSEKVPPPNPNMTIFLPAEYEKPALSVSDLQAAFQAFNKFKQKYTQKLEAQDNAAQSIDLSKDIKPGPHFDSPIVSG